VRTQLAASAVLLAVACATSGPPPAPSPSPDPYALAKPGAPVEVTSAGVPGQAEAVRAERKLGTVRSVDLAARSVKLEWMGGGLVTFTVGPELKLLETMSPGDSVLVDVEQRLLLEVQPPGAESVPYTVSGTRAAYAPGGLGESGVRATVTVTRVDLGTRIVTFADPTGAKYDVKAGPGLRIEQLKAGDRLLATYAQAIAVRIEKAPAKP
jgi:hypothetical protein